MVKHIVMFKLANKTPENMDTLTRALKGLAGNIETLRFLEVGTDFKESDRSYDIVLTTHFDDKEGLVTYGKHKNHLPVLDLVGKLCASTVVVDYELP